MKASAYPQEASFCSCKSSFSHIMVFPHQMFTNTWLIGTEPTTTRAISNYADHFTALAIAWTELTLTQRHSDGGAKIIWTFQRMTKAFCLRPSAIDQGITWVVVVVVVVHHLVHFLFKRNLSVKNLPDWESNRALQIHIQAFIHWASEP